MRPMLKVRLAEAGMTGRELARRCDVSENTVWLWTTERGLMGMTLRRMTQVAEVLGCSVCDLFEE